jgi:hypothetical protein
VDPVRLGISAGIPALLGFAALVGAVGAALRLLPSRPRAAVTQAVIGVILVGLLRDLISTIIQTWGAAAALVKWMFALSGLTCSEPFFLVIGAGLLALCDCTRAKSKQRGGEGSVGHGWCGW